MHVRCLTLRTLGSIAFVLALALGLSHPTIASAQELVTAGRGPRFLVAPTPNSTPKLLDLRTAPALRRQIALRLTDATMTDALAAITKATGIAFVYGLELLPTGTRVNLRAEQITVAAALTQILIDTDLDVLAQPSGRQLALIKRRSELRAQAGSIAGRVTDAKTGEALVGAEVGLEGTRLRTATGDKGFYKLADVPAGSHVLAVRRVGYRKQTQAVTVTDGTEIAVNIALQPVVTQLDELVTTVTGEQRLRELGHVVGRINADSLVKEAPVATVTELLSARVPGLLVQQHQGSVGGEVKLQIRSPSSIFLSNEPIVIVDGIRYTSSSRGTFSPGTASTGVGLFGVEGTSRLNDINPHDIESIEVVKGPSAVTLYGTDAANGVIVITTKRGRAGPAQWSAYASSDVRAIPRSVQQYPDVWWGWQSAGGVPTLTNSCSLQQRADGVCAQDSITVLRNPLNGPELSAFGGEPSWAYGASVAGGQPSLRYTVSAGLTDATGPIELPSAFLDSIKAARGVAELPPELLKPNTQSQFSLRSAIGATLSPRLEVQVQATYARAATRAASFSGIFTGPYIQTPENPTLGGTPLQEAFSQTSTEWTNRFTGSTGLTWKPTSWLQSHGTVGLDIANSRRYSLARRGETPTYSPTGTVGEDRTQQIATSADLGMTAMLRRGRLSSRTSIGAQYTKTLYDELRGRGDYLPAQGGSSINQAGTRSVEQRYSEGAALGTYVEQVFGLNDRLFVTGAVRLDGATGFGQLYEVTAYPKLGFSWLVSEEPFFPRLPGLDELRFRYAFGASGRQPVANWTQAQFDAFPGITLDGTTGLYMNLISLGNPDLRPERVREHEFGLDATALQNRVQLDLTWNNRRTRDMIVQWTPPYSAGTFEPINTNLARVNGRGFEASVTVRALETQLVTWDLRLQHSWQDNTVAERGNIAQQPFYGIFLEGYPLAAFTTQPLLGYADANGDGIIEAGEVEVGDTAVYVGRRIPPRTQTLGTTVGLFAQRVRISALFDRQSGAVNWDESWITQCQLQRCRAVVDPTTSLAKQAQAVATAMGAHRPVSSTDFAALREVSVAFDVPTSVRRALRLQSLSASIAARNLARWSSFRAFDPQTGAGRVPLARAWAFRVNAGF